MLEREASQPLLTIGIPTYNGLSYLRETLRIALDQRRDVDAVEVLVCDNASDDGTAEFMAQLTRDTEGIRYVRHAANMGMDRNFWSVVQQASGRFVHLLGDDDFYTPNAVERLLDVLRSHEDLDVVLLSNNYLNTLNDRLMENQGDSGSDVLCPDAASFYANDELKSLCLSNVVVRTERCRSIANIEKYFGCQWLHLAILLSALERESRSFIFSFARPAVTVRIGNQRWLDRGGAVAYYYSALDIFDELIDSSCRPSALDRYRKRFLPFFARGDKIKFDSFPKNLEYCLKLFKIYGRSPKAFLKMAIRLLLSKRKPFFAGWETLGT